MLTNKEMKKIAKLFVAKLSKENNIELILIESSEEKPYGKIYGFDSKEFFLTGDVGKAIGNSFPFLVEKKTGRVVTFGTLLLENYLTAYENGTLDEVSDRYWYPEEDRYDSK